MRKLDDNEVLDLHQRFNDGREAETLMNSRIFKAAFTGKKAQLFEALCATKFWQHKQRTEVWRSMKNLDSIEQYFQSIVDDGKMAGNKLKNYGKLQEHKA
jgi:hypothetical protein